VISNHLHPFSNTNDNYSQMSITTTASALCLAPIETVDHLLSDAFIGVLLEQGFIKISQEHEL
jgi:hypothetical protein